MTWYFLGGILLLLGIVFLVYYFRKELLSLQEGFQSTNELERVVMCNLPENANSKVCELPDDPNRLPPETSQETEIFNRYEEENVRSPPPYKQTAQEEFNKKAQLNQYDYTNGPPWDFDNKDQDPNVVLWGFVHPKCTKEIFLSGITRDKYSSINNMNFDFQEKIFTYIIPVFNNLEVSGEENIAMFKFAEFITNFALGVAVENIVNTFASGLWTGMSSLLKSERVFIEDNPLYHRALSERTAEYELIRNRHGNWYDLNQNETIDRKIQAMENELRVLNQSSEFRNKSQQERARLIDNIKERPEYLGPDYKTKLNTTRKIKTGGKIGGAIVAAGVAGASGQPFAALGIGLMLGVDMAISHYQDQPLNPSHNKAAGGSRIQGARVGGKAATHIGTNLATRVARAMMSLPAFAAVPVIGQFIIFFEIVWLAAVVIVLPVLMSAFIPPDGVCPAGYPYNAEEDVVRNCGQVCWEIVVNIPVIGDLLNALGPYLCHNTAGQARAKQYYEAPLYYQDSSLSIHAMSDKPLIPKDDPAYNDQRQYYQLVGYDYDSLIAIRSINRYINMMQKAGDLNRNRKAAPPIWVDFSHPTMLNKMAEYYYKTSRRLPYTNYDGSISFEYISKIYGVAASTKFSCDIQCEITIDTLYAETGVLKSRIIVPSNGLGNTYHDRRFYFFVDDKDYLHNETIHGNLIQYYYKMPDSSKSSIANLQARDATFYSGAGDWNILMNDNMMRYIITGCTCVDYTAPQAFDSTTAGYAGDLVVSVSNPNTFYFNPTLATDYSSMDAIPNDAGCNTTRGQNMYSKLSSAPMKYTSRKKSTTSNDEVRSIMYDGMVYGKDVKNNGDLFQLTIALTSDKKLTFKEIDQTTNHLSLKCTKSKSYTGVSTGNSNSLRGDGDGYNENLNGIPARIRAQIQGNPDSQISFDAIIVSTTTNGDFRECKFRNISNIRGNFLTNNTPTTLVEGVILYPSRWSANSTKIWNVKQTGSISPGQRAGTILQGIGTSIIAQAPGLGIRGQVAGGLLLTTLDATRVLDQLACLYMDVKKQEGTYVVNGNVLTSVVNKDQDSFLIERGPTIDYSPGYIANYNKCSNMTLTQNVCINRYNVRLAIKKYVDFFTDKRIKRIFKIRTYPDNNMCVYDVEQTGFDPINTREFEITNKIISFGINYELKQDTCSYVPLNNIILNTPTINEISPIDAPVDPRKVGYRGDSPSINIKTADCKLYSQMTCGTYKLRKQLYTQFNKIYNYNPSINPNTINKTLKGTIQIGTRPTDGMGIAITYGNNPSPPSNGEVILLDDPNTNYRFEGIFTNNQLTNIDIIYPYTETISVVSSANLNSVPINNALWLVTDNSVHITRSDNTNFNAVVTNYENNIASFTPYISGVASTINTSTITLRYNNIATITYPYTYTYTFPSQTFFSSNSAYTTINITIGTAVSWLQANMNINIILDNNTIYGNVVSYDSTTGALTITIFNAGSYNTKNITIQGRDTNKITLEFSPNTIVSTSDDFAITYITPAKTEQILSNNIRIQNKQIDSTTKRIRVDLPITNNQINNTGTILVRLIENWSNKTYNVYTISAYGTRSVYENDPSKRICTYNTEHVYTDYNIEQKKYEQTTENKILDFVITPSNTDPSRCLYDILYDSAPTKLFFPNVPEIGKYIEIPVPLPQPELLSMIPNCTENQAYRDCSGIDLVTRLVDKYNSSNVDTKILKVLRAYTLKTECEYQVEMSKQIPNSRDSIIKNEFLRFNMIPSNGCTYTYKDQANPGWILNLNQVDPYSGSPDTFALSPPYIWPTSLVDRYRRLINQAISMYQSMKPTWSSILEDVSQTSENRMKGIFNEIYANRTMGDCVNLTCRDNDTLTKIIRQYNYKNYPSYTPGEQYGYIQRSIIEIRRGGLGGTLTQCHIELIEQQDYYEDYTSSPIQSDDPKMARFNTKYFLRQYQFDVEIANCAVTKVLITKDDINKNIMDISSNPFGIQSDVSIVKFTPSNDLFNLSEFYRTEFLKNKIASKYNTTPVNNNPLKYNTITKFINAFIVSPTICEYQIQIKRAVWSDEYRFWFDVNNIDSYISVTTDESMSSRNILNIRENIIADITFQLENEKYTARGKDGKEIQLQYMFYADLTDTKSRIKGFSSSGATKVPNTDSSGYVVAT
jgi:hypothetical protein